MKKTKFPVFLRWFAFLFVIAVGLVYLVLPAGFGLFAVIPAKTMVSNPPEEAEKISLITADNVQLAGWYTPPKNGSVVLLIHGAGGSREDVRAYYEMLTRNGYGVLALDMRGHGESQGKTNRFGWQATSDIGAAVEFLTADTNVMAIGGMGLSLGGEGLLGSASAYPEIQAIVADGATRRSLDELIALESERPLSRNFTARVMYASVQLFSGEKPPTPLLESMKDAGSTAFLFIAAEKEPLEIQFGQLFVNNLTDRSDLWIVPEASHTTAFQQYPVEYEQRVIQFFDSTLFKAQ